MISIDFLFLSMLCGALCGSAYLRTWKRRITDREKQGDYGKIYSGLRGALPAFLLSWMACFLALKLLARLCGLNAFFSGEGGRILMLLLFGIAVAWLAGAAVYAFRYMVEVASFLRILEYNEEPDFPGIADIFQEIATRQHIYRHIRIYMNPKVRVSMIFGVFRKVILLPATIRGEQELRVILEHEMVHAGHNDLLFGRAAAVLSFFFWFVPEARKLPHGMEEWNEVLCDFTVCKSKENGWDRQGYFRQIVGCAREVPRVRIPTAAAMGLSMGRSEIRVRILRMKHFEDLGKAVPWREERIRARWIRLLCIVSLAFALFAAHASVQELAAELYGGGFALGAKAQTVEQGNLLRYGRTVIPSGFTVRRPVFLQEGEEICISYDADVQEGGEENGLLGMLGVCGVRGGQKLDTPVSFGQDSVTMTAGHTGWYVVSVENSTPYACSSFRYMISIRKLLLAEKIIRNPPGGSLLMIE